MVRKQLSLSVFVCSMMLVFAGPATADNTTAANAHPLVLGEETTDPTAGAATFYYYQLQLYAGRSYQLFCWVTGLDAAGDCEVGFVTSDGLAVLAGSDQSATREPRPYAVDAASDNMASFIPATTGAYHIVVNDDTAVAGGVVHAMVIETTLFSPWYFVNAANGYDGFIEISNNTSATAANVVVTAYNSDGTERGSTTVSIPANGNTLVQVTTLGAADGFGSVQIAHRQMPGGIRANITTLSATTGLSFDAPFTSRTPGQTF